MSLRLPAFGKEVASLLRAGRRPIGSICVTTRWDLCRAYARVVCPPDVPPEYFDLSFLRGQEVIVVVPKVHEELGHRLLAAVRAVYPRRAILFVKHDAKGPAA